MSHGIAMGKTETNSNHLSLTSFVKKQPVKTISKVLSCLLFLLFFIYSVNATTYPAPDVFLSYTEMTQTGGYDAAGSYSLNTNGASLSKSVTLTKSGPYRVDFSAWNYGSGTASVAVSIGSTTGTASVPYYNTETFGIYSVFFSNIAAGTYTLTISIAAGGTNKTRVGLVYATQTTLTTPPALPAIQQKSLVKGQILTGDHFGSKVLRGFNTANIPDIATLNSKNLAAMRATGANLLRVWIAVSHDASDNYYWANYNGAAAPNALIAMDSVVNQAERMGFYVIISMQVLPEGTAFDAWGTTATAITRKNNIKGMWQTLATRYNGRYGVAGYDLINEPRGTNNYAEYIRWQQDEIEAIRTIDPNHVIFLECIANVMYSHILPLPFNNIVYAPHSYSPMKITHQGVDAYSGSTTPSNTYRNTYPTTALDGTGSAFNATSFATDNHKAMRTMSQRFNVPVWIGEFSCINWAPASPNGAGKWTSTEWINDNIATMESYGWSWCYHAWRAWQGWEAEIPSSYYTQFAYSNAAPVGLPSYSTWVAARSDTAPTLVMLKSWFASNNTTNNIINNIYYRDYDNDGYGNATDTVKSASQPMGYVTAGGDCNDSSATIHPGATEICGNGIDDNCDGKIDEVCSITPSLAIDSVTVYESDGTATLNVSLSTVVDSTVSFGFSTMNGTAVRAEDYRAIKGTIKIPAGTGSGQIKVKILPTTETGSTEYFYVKITSPVNATIAKAKGVINIIHGAAMKVASSSKQSNLVKVPVQKLSLKVLPNPSTTHFTLKTQSSGNEPIALRVVNMAGEIVETKQNIAPNSVLTIGSSYPAGIYYSELFQGTERTMVKLVKQ